MEAKATIIFCDNVINNFSNGRMVPSISRPLTSITPRSIPGNYTFAIFFSIENVPKGSHTLQLELYNTQNIKIFDSNIIELKSGLNLLGDVYAPIEASAEIRNAVIETAGRFRAVVILDNNEISEQILEVKKNV